MHTVYQLHCASFFPLWFSSPSYSLWFHLSSFPPFWQSALSLLSVIHHLWLERFRFTLKFLFHWDVNESAHAIYRLMEGAPSIKVILTVCILPSPQYVQRRQQENTQRQSRGEPPLPEEDLTKLFKPPQPPPRMDSLLIAGQFAHQPFYLQDHWLKKPS